MTGTAAISSPLSELDRCYSALDSSSQGRMTSTAAKAASHFR
jgi:hypothetical protein